MYRLALILICVILLGSLNANAQSKQTKFADKYFEAFNFDAAAESYKAILEKKNIDDKFYVLSQIGDCYRLQNDTKEAEKWYAKAVAESGASADIVYQYAQMLRSNSKYSPALIEFKRYQEMEPSDAHVAEIISGLIQVEKLLKQNEAYHIQITPFNSGSSDFAPYIYEDQLYFASNGFASAGAKNDVWTDRPFLQVQKVEVSGYDQFGEVSKLSSKKLNGNFHDGPVCVDPKSKDLYLTRSNYKDKKVTKDDEDNVNLKIMRKAQTEEGHWDGDIIDDFPFNSDDYSVGHASISADGKTIYFASDMPHADAQGGVDIYMATREGDSWGSLKNLGTKINSRGNERFPFISSEGHLFFASDGLPGLGGMDVFEAIPSTDGSSWAHVLNMGAPLNTNYDDFALVLKDEVREGYFTSNRPSEFGDDDIYSFKDGGIRLIGKVIDATTGEPICESDVKMLLGSQELGATNTECDGNFRFAVEPGKTYDFSGCAKGYTCNTDVSASTKGLAPGSVVEVEIPIRKEVPIALTVIVIDQKTKQPISTSRVNFYDACSGKRTFKQSDAAGSSQHDAAEGCEYFIGAMAKSYFPKDTIVSSEGIIEDMEVVIELSQEGMFDVAGYNNGTGGNGIVFYHIYYDFDESYIRDDANPDLQRVLDFMLENPEANVQIESHTDARAPYQYNIDLSKRRAAAAKAWLESKGIAADRLHSIGFGEIRPANGCVDNVKCTEEEHQQNRRTEFRLVSGRINTVSLQRFDVKVDPCTNCSW
ncbi:MAG: OmpA family protein [Chitinophagales bacterium]